MSDRRASTIYTNHYRTLMQPQHITIDDYDYPLPESSIAAHPLAERDRCRLLVRHPDGTLSDCIFTDLPSLLPKGALLIYNNTRVINARLKMRKLTGAVIEVFCLEPHTPADYALNFASTHGCSWHCIVGNSKRWKEGEVSLNLCVDGRPLTLYAERVSVDGAESVVRFRWDDPEVSFSRIIESAGQIPIPPYLNRASEESDATDYQTVYSRIEGSVAAPTAGLHFTPSLLESIDRAGIRRAEVTLHVGAGTFRPVKSDTIGDHPMHGEFINVSRALIEQLAAETGPVIAVGTTTVRTLESLYHLGCMVWQGRRPDDLPQWYPYEEDHPRLSAPEAFRALLGHMDGQGADRLIANTHIIIAPGYRFMVVDGMVTNFHQPRSTLLLLVSAFTGGDWLPMYTHALQEGYRFLSYGDAQLLL